MAGLGKGLSALLSEDSLKNINNTSGFIPNLPVNKIMVNPYQPRVEFNPEQLVELADSIREHGVIEPLLVTKHESGKYELIAGERRWRAAQLAGIEHIPVVIKEASPQEMLELAVIENVQRQDLNPLEEAMAFDQLAKVFNLTHDVIAKKVGVSRPAIANKIRLLSLPDEIKKGMLEGKISEGHARALLGLDTKEKIIATYKVVLRDHLSVRALEELVRRLNKAKQAPTRPTERIIDEKTEKYENLLRSKLNNKVAIARTLKGGKITIPFKNDDELESIINAIS